MEKIIIDNFAGISHFELELNNINLLIGQQTSGKSICAKLLYFFKYFDLEFTKAIENGKDKRELKKILLNKFDKYFPFHTYSDKAFQVKYVLNNTFIEIKKNGNNKLEINYSDYYTNNYKLFQNEYRNIKEELNKTQNYNSIDLTLKFRDFAIGKLKKDIASVAGNTQVYIPAGRAFYANFQKQIFSLMASDTDIDPFLIEFGSFYENIKDNNSANCTNLKQDEYVAKVVNTVLYAQYLREKGIEYLIHKDGRKVNLVYSSSGQQEILPLIIILNSLLYIIFAGHNGTIFIEEPEAHLFPNSQKLIVELIAYIYNISQGKYQFVITTHSPYILASFNNLIQAGMLKNQLDETEKSKLYETVNQNIVLSPNELSAYSLSENTCELIMNEVTGLIDGNILDEVSNDIAIQFDKILDLM